LDAEGGSLSSPGPGAAAATTTTTMLPMMKKRKNERIGMLALVPLLCRYFRSS